MSSSIRRRGAGALILIGVVAAFAALAGGGEAASSAAPQNTSPPTVSGTPQQSQTLSGTRGQWSGTVSDYNYFWTRCNRNGGGCSNISGAHAATYKLGSADVGNTIRFKVQAKNADGDTFASSVPTAVIQAPSRGPAPANTSPPTISGTPQENQTLTGGAGTWTNNPTGFDYFWMRCDRSGSSCADIQGANRSTYVVSSVDVGNTLRLRVHAKNAGGTTSATSAQTAVLQPALAPGAAISVTQVSLPDRLVIDRVSFSPSPARSRGPIVARFHVAEVNGGHPVQGALVYALGLPYGWVRNAAETPTDGSGWATITLTPTRALPLRPGALVVFVRARKQGENVLAGVSTRRLVQESIR
jgi:hypothetical protein